MASKFIGLSFLLALMLPALIAHADRRRFHDAFYGAVALAGLGYAGIIGGLASASVASVQGIAVMTLLCSGVACAQIRLQSRYLTGGEIKLAAAGATWLHPIGAIMFLLAAATIIFGILFMNRARVRHRPDVTAISASVLIAAFLFSG